MKYKIKATKYLLIYAVILMVFLFGSSLIAASEPHKLDDKSIKELSTVHPDLQKIVKLASSMTAIDFRVNDGKRTQAEQVINVRHGASKTMRSRHLTGHAVDLWIYKNGKVSWKRADYEALDAVMQKAARQYDIKIEWGGRWKSFEDLPHWQLSRSQYPGI